MWAVVVPVKELSGGKSRLRGALPGVAHERLALALAWDTVAAAVACDAVGEVLVVTDDRVAARALGETGARVVPDRPAAGLNAALTHGEQLAGGPDAAVAALIGDLPALRPAELAAALRAVDAGSGRAGPPNLDDPRPPGRQHDPSPPGQDRPSSPPGQDRHSPPRGRFYVPDAGGTGTTLLAAAAGVPLDPLFGAGSAAAHAASGAALLAGPWPTLRRDVDTAADLAAAAALGLGPHTAALGYPPGMQGTVATYDADSRSGTLLLDDGTELAFPAAAFDASGLRLLRLGQRVRVEHDDAGHVVRVTLPTL